MKLLLMVAVATMWSFGGSSKDGGDTHEIAWQQNQKLVWKDFEGPAEENSVESASSSVGLEVGPVEGTDSLLVTAFFDKATSWTKITDNDALLRHEQLHFDIAEVMARRLRKALRERSVARANFQTRLDDVYESMDADLNAMQDDYDMETEHSTNTAKQQQWENKIAGMLYGLRAYEQPTILIRYK